MHFVDKQVPHFVLIRTESGNATLSICAPKTEGVVCAV